MRRKEKYSSGRLVVLNWGKKAASLVMYPARFRKV